MSKQIKVILTVVLAIIVVSWFASVQFDTEKKKYDGLPTVQKKAPDFELKNEKGDSVRLNDFKGKIIYVKFWASWCGDCIKQVVPQRKLEEEWSQNDQIAFVNISVDDNLEDWHKSVLRNKLIGVELISKDGEESGISENYGINEIPRYVLIGKDGLIIDNNAPKPSEMSPDYFSNFLQ